LKKDEVRWKISLKRGKINSENGGPLTWKAQDFIFLGEAQCFPSEGWENGGS